MSTCGPEGSSQVTLRGSASRSSTVTASETKPPVGTQSGPLTGVETDANVGGLLARPVGHPDTLKHSLATTPSLAPARAPWKGPAAAAVDARPSTVVVHAAYTTSSFGAATDTPSRGGSAGSAGHVGGSPGSALENRNEPVEGRSTDTNGVREAVEGANESGATCGKSGEAVRPPSTRSPFGRRAMRTAVSKNDPAITFSKASCTQRGSKTSEGDHGSRRTTKRSYGWLACRTRRMLPKRLIAPPGSSAMSSTENQSARVPSQGIGVRPSPPNRMP